MLSYMRNKLISVARGDEGTLSVHGVLDDDLYGLWVKIGVTLAGMEVTSIEGGWNRWTTPECWRSVEPLQQAVGLRIEPGMRQNITKSIGRSACRHFANLLLECCHAAAEAAEWIREQDHGRGLERKGSSPGRPPRKDESERHAVTTARSKPSGGTIIDLHVHTSNGSPCSSAPVDDLIEEAKRIGLDGICLTDHNHVWEREALEDLRQRHGFPVLGGNEITTDQGDVLVFGLDKNVEGIIMLGDLREAVLASGGYMILAHPFRGFLVFDMGQLGLTPEKAMERPLFRSVDAVEVLNGKVTEKENAFAADVARGLGVPGTGGSDAHDVREVGVYATWFPGRIGNERDLIHALKQGSCLAVHYREDWTKESKEG